MKKTCTKTALAFFAGGLSAMLISVMSGVGATDAARSAEDWFEGEQVTIDLSDGTTMTGTSISSRAALDRRWWYVQQAGEPPKHFVINPDQVTRVRLTP